MAPFPPHRSRVYPSTRDSAPRFPRRPSPRLAWPTLLVIAFVGFALPGCGEGGGGAGTATISLRTGTVESLRGVQLGNVADIDAVTVDVFDESDLTLVGGEVDFSELDGLAALRLAADVEAFPGQPGQWLATIANLPLEEVRVIAYGHDDMPVRIFRGASAPTQIVQGVDTPVTVFLDAIDDGFGIAVPGITFLNVPDVIDDEFTSVLVQMFGLANEELTFLFTSADGTFDVIEVGDGTNPGDVTADPNDPLNLAAGRVLLDASGSGTVSTVYTDVGGTAGVNSQLTVKITNSQGNSATSPISIYVEFPPPVFSRETDILYASDAEAGDQFGHSVAIDGDFLIVGAWHEATGGSTSGAAYIFERTPGTDTWGTVTKIVAADPVAADEFGVSVGISGDHAIIGSWKVDDGPGNNGGAIYFFKRDAGTGLWDAGSKFQHSLLNGGGDMFGTSVGISGTYAVAGARREDSQGANAGSAYIFKWNGLSWAEQTVLFASDAEAGDAFGEAVGISGDVAIVGAWQEATGGASAGAAYIYRRNGSDVWDAGVKIVPDTPAAGDRFGYAVSIDGDYAVVGAYLQADAGTGAGAAYVFFWDGGSWSQQAMLLASDGEANDEFGRSVFIKGDRIMVGARLEDTGANNGGAAYIFERSGTTWPEIAKITASDAQAGDNFGWAVAIDDDYAVVGARNEDTFGANAGAVYTFK